MRPALPFSAAMVSALLLTGPAAALAQPAAPGAAPAASEAAPADRMELETTKIIGNRELPKVLYIVPWKRPVPTTLSGKPPASVLDEALAPIDRDVFRREVAYGANAPDAKLNATAPDAKAAAKPEPAR